METIKDLKSKKNLTSNIIQWRILCTKITVLCSKNRLSVNATLAKMTKAKSCQSSVHLSCCYFFICCVRLLTVISQRSEQSYPT